MPEPVPFDAALSTSITMSFRSDGYASHRIVWPLSTSNRNRVMIYIASPYTHSDVRVREWRLREACRAAAVLLRQA